MRSFASGHRLEGERGTTRVKSDDAVRRIDWRASAANECVVLPRAHGNALGPIQGRDMSALLLMLLAAPPGLTLEVFVPLCDSTLIACGKGAAGDPDSLSGNLYWGAAYGAERYLSRAPSFRVDSKTDTPQPEKPYLLREVWLTRKPTGREQEV